MLCRLARLRLARLPRRCFAARRDGTRWLRSRGSRRRPLKSKEGDALAALDAELDAVDATLQETAPVEDRSVYVERALAVFKQCAADHTGGPNGVVFNAMLGAFQRGGAPWRPGRVERHAHARRHALEVLCPPGELCADALLAAALRLPQRVVGVLQLQRRHGLLR